MIKLDIKTKKAIIKMSDTLEDINQKLDHIIRKQTENFMSIDSKCRR